MLDSSNDWRISEEDQRRIIQALDRAGAVRRCPRCRNRDFALIPGYLSPLVHRQVKGVKLAGPSIPLAGVICSRCGWLALHAVASLGLMDQACRDSQASASDVRREGAT